MASSFSFKSPSLAATLAFAFTAVMPLAAHAETKDEPAKKPAKAAPAKAQKPPAPAHAKPLASAPNPAKPTAPKPAPKKVAAVDSKGSTPKHSKPVAAPPKPPCVKAPVEMTTGAETAKFTLGTCDGHAAPLAVENLSILARGGAPKPAQPIAELAKVPGQNIAKGIRRFDPGLVVRLQRVVDHFAKGGEPPKILVVSGYRPASTGSYHAHAKALDFRLEGVTNEALVAFCKTMDDTGCGYYPNSVFVHMDVREGAGHVSWIDASGPGEKPRYVTTWPPPKEAPSLALPSSPHPPRPIGPFGHAPADDPDDLPAGGMDHEEP